MVEDKYTELLQDFQSDLTQARATQNQVLANVDEWWGLYEGEYHIRGDASMTTTKTAYPAQRDIQRVVESSLPDIVSPFVTDDDLVVVLPRSGDTVAKAEALTHLINRQFSKSIDKLEFMENIARNIQIEGSVFTKVGWSEDMPIVENIPITDLMLDPSAKRMKDLQFAIQRRKVSRSEILNNSAWFGSHSEEDILQLEGTVGSEYDNYRNQGNGMDDSFNFEDSARELVEVFEYYGMYDLEGTGTPIPILAIWHDNTLLRVSESPYPESFNGIPFECAVYTRNPDAIYGNSVAEMLKTSQRFRQAINTGIRDNLSNATNGQTFVKKGALDPLNRKAFLNGKRLVDFNIDPAQALEFGSFNEINPAIFQLSEELKREQEELSGMTAMASGLDPRSLNSGVSATAVNITNSNAAKRMLQITRHVSEMLERVFSKWVVLNQMMLQEGMVKDGEEYFPVNGEMLQGGYDINIQAGTAGIKQSKIQNLQAMMSMTSQQQLPPEINLSMMIEMSKLMDMPAMADQLTGVLEMSKEPQQPNPEKQAAMQLEFAEKQATIEHKQAQSMKLKSESMKNFVETERASYGL
ncbi:MAG: portal protein [Candidatus Thorarchaeota archaeon]